MKPEDIIKATRNSLNIYSFTAEALERLIAAVQSEHKCQTCESLARTVMMDQTAHDTHTAAKREWVGLTEKEIEALASWWPSYDQMPALMVLVKDIQNSIKEKNT